MKIDNASFVFSLVEFSLALVEFVCTFVRSLCLLVEPVCTFGEGFNNGLTALLLLVEDHAAATPCGSKIIVKPPYCCWLKT